MKNLAVVFVLLVGCGGGDKKEEGGEEKRTACTAAVERGVSMTVERRLTRGPASKSPELKKLVEELGPKLKTAMTELCVNDQWAETVISCFQTAEDIAKCKDGLKPEQRSKYTQAMMKIMMAGRPGMNMTGAAGHGGMGGSAGAPSPTPPAPAAGSN